MDSENRLTAVRGEEIGGWVRKVKGLSKEKKERLMDTDNSLVITRGKGDYGRGRRGYGKTHGDGRRPRIRPRGLRSSSLPKCQSVCKWIKSCGTFTQWNTTQQSKRRKCYLL